MNSATQRIGGVLVLALALSTLSAIVVMAALTKRHAAGDGAHGPHEARDSDPAGAALARSMDDWLAAQPLSAHPPAALPAEFWHTPSAQQPAHQPPSAQRLAVVRDGPLHNVVLHSEDGQIHDLTRFTQPQHVYDMAISPDGRLGWVWHMAFPPRQISVYDLATCALLHRFTPAVIIAGDDADAGVCG